MTARQFLRVNDYLPTPPPLCHWVTGSETTYGDKPTKTFYFTLVGPDSDDIGGGRIAIEIYGWDAVRERAQAIVDKYQGKKAIR